MQGFHGASIREEFPFLFVSYFISCIFFFFIIISLRSLSLCLSLSISLPFFISLYLSYIYIHTHAHSISLSFSFSPFFFLLLLLLLLLLSFIVIFLSGRHIFTNNPPCPPSKGNDTPNEEIHSLCEINRRYAFSCRNLPMSNPWSVCLPLSLSFSLSVFLSLSLFIRTHNVCHSNYSLVQHKRTYACLFPIFLFSPFVDLSSTHTLFPPTSPSSLLQVWFIRRNPTTHSSRSRHTKRGSAWVYVDLGYCGSSLFRFDRFRIDRSMGLVN